MTRVLAIGLTAEADTLTTTAKDKADLQKTITDADAEVEAAGYELVRQWITDDYADCVESVRALLKDAPPFDIVVIGGGIRIPSQLTEVFEQLMNVVHAGAPQAKLAFDALPSGALEALRRNV